MRFPIRFFACCVLTMVQLAVPAAAAAVKVGDLVITQLWARATPAGAKVGSAYFTVENTGSLPDRLVSVSAPGSKGEIYEMSMTNGAMAMRLLESGLTIAPGQKVTLTPGGFHLMFSDLKGAFKQGETLNVSLRFEKAGQIDAAFDVFPVGSRGPANAQGKPAGMDHGGHSGMKM